MNSQDNYGPKEVEILVPAELNESVSMTNLIKRASKVIDVEQLQLK